MQIICSAVLAKSLTEAAKGLFTVKRITVKPDVYRAYIDYNLFAHENDFNYNNNTFRAFEIVYPDGYYACNRYITTNDLERIFRGIQAEKTLENFAEAFIEECEI